jgi:PAS domain S-box-containing protein
VHADLDVIRTADGAPERLIKTIVDITARVQAEESQRLFRALTDRSPDAIEVVDPETGRFLDVNQTAYSLLGYTRQEFLELSVPDIDPGTDARAFTRNVRDVRRSGPITFETVHRRKDGSTFPVEINFAVVSLDRDYGVAIARDISSRRVEEAERRRLSTAIEQATDWVVITDADGKIQYANAAFEAISGFERAEVLGRNPRIFKSGSHDDSYYREMWQTIASGGAWTGDVVNVRKDGTFVHLHETIFPVADEAGKIVNYVAIAHDASRERALEAQLNQAQKMEAVGRLAGGVAHDFNNVLSVISVSAELMLAGNDLSDSGRQDLEQIKEASRRGASLTRQLLAFSRRQTLELRVLDLNTVIADVEKMLVRLIGEHIELSVVPGRDLGAVVGSGLVVAIQRKDAQELSVPFGSYIALSAVIAATSGHTILNWYLSQLR